MKFYVNGTEFIIDSFPSGFSWTTDRDESVEYFPCRYVCQQDAINYVRAQNEAQSELDQQRLEDEVFGSYEQQKRMLHDSITR